MADDPNNPKASRPSPLTPPSTPTPPGSRPPSPPAPDASSTLGNAKPRRTPLHKSTSIPIRDATSPPTASRPPAPKPEIASSSPEGSPNSAYGGGEPVPEVDTTPLSGEARVGSTAAASFYEAPSSLSAFNVDIQATVEPAAQPTTLIFSPRNDESWTPGLADQLNVERDAHAFARLAASREFRPPLAVGVFGSWGAGKSFFMRLVYEHIERLKAGTVTAEVPEASDEVFHRDIVQIKFNAWHYVDTNLWASLVDHLFVELAASTKKDEPGADLLGALRTAQDLTFEAAASFVGSKQEHARAMSALAIANAARAEAEAHATVTLPVFARALETVLRRTDDAELQKSKVSLAEAANALGITAGLTDVKELGADAEALLVEGRGLTGTLSGVVRNLPSNRGAWVLLALVAACPLLVVGAAHLLSAVAPWLKDIHDGVYAFTATLAGLLGSGKAILSRWNAELARFQNAQRAIEAAVRKQMEPDEEKLKDAQAKLRAADSAVAAAKEALRLSNEHLAKAAENFYGSTSEGRLVNFVRARATDGEYAAHQGLIATIRRDFEELSRGLGSSEDDQADAAAARRAEFKQRIRTLIDQNLNVLSKPDKDALEALAQDDSTAPRSFKRIVLYIDDLDRCPPDKVVEVLQAVHMLLAFPLFVVFVAVDIRWVAGALENHFVSMFEGSSETGRPIATDYLEKIFQIPYWLPEVDAQTGSSLFDSLFPRAEHHSPAAPHIPVSAEFLHAVPTQIDVTDIERDALRDYAVYAGGSPRKIIRYANIYRLLKAGGYTPESPSTYDESVQALIAQLAIATALPHVFSEWMRLVDKVAESSQGSGDLASELARSGLDAIYASALSDVLAEFSQKTMNVFRGSGGAKALAGYGALVRRFSFAS